MDESTIELYDKAQTDTLLDEKADADDVYTKAEMDTALSSKADADEVYTKGETVILLNNKENTLPSMSGNAGKVLAVNSDATGKVWVNKGRSVTTTTDINVLISFMKSAIIGDQIILAFSTDYYGMYTKTPYNWVGGSRPISTSGQRRNYCYVNVNGTSISFTAVRPNASDGTLSTSIDSVIGTAYMITYT